MTSTRFSVVGVSALWTGVLLAGVFRSDYLPARRRRRTHAPPERSGITRRRAQRGAAVESNGARCRIERNAGPPIVARALAIVHTAMHDAWAAYDEVAIGTRLGGSLRRPSAEHTLANRAEAVSFAAYRALVERYPDRKLASMRAWPTIR
jgi:hypothetical protein